MPENRFPTPRALIVQRGRGLAGGDSECQAVLRAKSPGVRDASTCAHGIGNF